MGFTVYGVLVLFFGVLDRSQPAMRDHLSWETTLSSIVGGLLKQVLLYSKTCIQRLTEQRPPPYRDQFWNQNSFSYLIDLSKATPP